MEREAAGLSSNRGREEMYLKQFGMVSKQSEEVEASSGAGNEQQQQQQPATRRRSVSSHPVFYHLCMPSFERSEMKLSSDHSDAIPRRYKTEYKKNFRPFSLYQYVDGQFCKTSSADHQQQQQPSVNQGQQQGTGATEKGGDPWYQEVVELRKKAGIQIKKKKKKKKKKLPRKLMT